MENMVNKKIHIGVIASEEGTETSFYFGGATISQLSMLNHELDILKLEIIERIRDAPKDYEMKHYDNEEDKEEAEE